MKRWKLVYLKRAQADLFEILEYIKRDSPERAKTWIEKIDRELGRLAQFPKSGHLPKDERLVALGYRMVILGSGTYCAKSAISARAKDIGDYLAFYVLRGKKIEVRRVLHGSRRYSFLI